MKELIALFLRGMLMGAADVVPGVSGGTMAFITGIYDRLLNAINAVLPALLSLLRERDFAKFWRQVDGTFLLCVLSGILCSVFSLASFISLMLETEPVLVWAFFFGLIVASIYVMRNDVSYWGAEPLICLVLGALFAWGLTSLELPLLQANLLGAFLSGGIAITAMILPGISGSLLLLVLGTYSYILGAVKSLDFAVIATFAGGCGLGLLLSARLLSLALNAHRNLTVAFLVGLMIGALNKVWPWKQTLSYRENSHGVLVPLSQENVGPYSYEAIAGAESQLLYAIVLFLCAYMLVIVVSHVGRRVSK